MGLRTVGCAALVGVIALSGATPLLAQDKDVAASGSKADAHRAFETLLARRVTIDVKDVSLKQALDSISQLTNVLIQYKAPMIDAQRTPVTIHANDMPLGVVLERVLDGTGLHTGFDGVSDLMIVDARRTADSIPQLGSVTGRIVDSATGRGISGATLKIIGTKISAITGDSGRFTLRNVPFGDRVVSAKMFGYRPMERSVSVTHEGNSVGRLPMVAAPNVLSGVVTTAAGVQDRRKVGNDITVINADSVQRVAPVTSVTDLLATRVPGLTVQRTSGIPGSPSRLRLRGIGGGLVAGAENTSNDPIVIVDGVRIYARQSTSRDQDLASAKPGAIPGPSFLTPSAIDQIDPNSIETIEVFKGPSATSQWGSDAGNGVIVITTKRGRAGPTQLSASISAGVTAMPGIYAAPGYYTFGRTSSLEAARSDLCNEIAYANTASACISVDSVRRFQAANSPRLSPFGTGTREEGSVQVSGGSAAFTYSVVGSASNDLGYLKMPSLYRDLYRMGYGTEAPDWMKRPSALKTWGANTTVGFVPTPGLQVTLGGAFTTEDQRQGSGQMDLATLSSIYLDTTSLKARGDAITVKDAVSAYVRRATTHNVTTKGNAKVDWTRWSRLPISTTGGVQIIERTDKQITPFGLADRSPSDTLGWFGVGHGRSVVTTGNAFTTVPLGSVLKAGLGTNWTETSTQDISAFKDTLQQGISEPAILSGGTERSSSLTTAGWFIEPQFSDHSGLTITPGFRFDGGSGSEGSGHALAVFPKLGFSWLAVDREGSRPLAGMVSLLRARLSFGVAGVQPEPAWKKRLMTDAFPPVSGSTPVPIEGVQLSTLGNPMLHPERSRELEGGFEATFWDGRANLNVTGYHKLRTDAIQQITTAPSVYGGQSFYINVGRVLNTGTDVSADARLLETGNVAWGVNATLSAYHNKLVTLYGDLPFIEAGNGTRLVQGYPLNGRWSRPILGYNDTNGDGEISIDEVSIADNPVYVGTGQPKIELPFGTTLSLWRGMVGITAQFDYKGGITQANTGGSRLLQNLYADTGATLGQQAVAIAAFQCGGNDNDACVSGTNYGLYQTVSVLRFNTFSVNYTVPSSLSTHLGIPRMSVALQASNLRLWSNYRGKDPDVNANVVGESISDTGIAPLPRSWVLRIDLRN